MEVKVKGFSLQEVDNPFKEELTFPKIRKFQKDFIENVEKFDILFLSAPTGAGKTLCFEYLCKNSPPVLLVYPTTTLMTDQERQLKEHGLKVFKLDSNSLGDVRGYARSRKLIAFFQRYDIIITNPDILSAILHHMYVNPEDDLLRIFNYFRYIVYDEFHIFKELELSDILLQLTLFLGLSKAKVVLSSATPSLEFMNVLQNIKPDCKIKVLEEKGSGDGCFVRYDTKVYITNEKFKEKVSGLIKSLIEKNLKTLVVCNSNKFARELYNSLIFEGYNDYITKDTGDETRGGVKADLSKLIIISTSKSEVGIDYPLDAIIMDVAPDLQSFIQRFGRISRKKKGIAFIFAKTIFNIGVEVEYPKFIEIIRDYFVEKRLSEKALKSILEFRAYLVLDKYKSNFDQLSHIFSSINWKKHYAFFKQLENSREKLSKYGTNHRDLEALTKFLDDYKGGLSLLRGQSVTAKIKYQRGEDWTFTSYDLLHSLNNYEINIHQNYIELLTPADNNMIKSIVYDAVEYCFYKFSEQLKHEILEIWKRLENFNLVQKDHRYLLKELLCVDLKRIIIPEEVVLRDGTKLNIRNYVNTSLASESVNTAPSNIL